jgi:hypothetical protein
MTAADPLVCWIDEDYDRDYASDGTSRYGAYLHDHAALFDPWGEAPDGVTSDPVEFAIAAFRCATGPIMAPGYARFHGRIQGHDALRSNYDGRLVLQVTLAVPSPVRLPWSWSGWEHDLFGGLYLEPDDRRPTGLCRLELHWPVPTEQLAVPAPPKVGRVPNLRDATRAVRVLVDQVNETTGAILAELETRR